MKNAFFVSAIYYHFLLTAEVTLVPHLLFCAADEPPVKNFKIESVSQREALVWFAYDYGCIITSFLLAIDNLELAVTIYVFFVSVAAYVNDVFYTRTIVFIKSRIEISQSLLSRNIAFKKSQRVLSFGNLLPFSFNCLSNTYMWFML